MRWCMLDMFIHYPILIAKFLRRQSPCIVHRIADHGATETMKYGLLELGLKLDEVKQQLDILELGTHPSE